MVDFNVYTGHLLDEDSHEVGVHAIAIEVVRMVALGADLDRILLRKAKIASVADFK